MIIAIFFQEKKYIMIEYILRLHSYILLNSPSFIYHPNYCCYAYYTENRHSIAGISVTCMKSLALPYLPEI